MARHNLQVRDLEVLRTIGRLHYVTTAELLSRFFPSDDIARRRLGRLLDHALITSHRKGVPASVSYEAWRLAPAGIDHILDCFPEEVFPDAFHDRLSDGSLINIDHREAVNRLYLDLIAPSGTSSSADRTEVLARARHIRSRADQIGWQADGTVILRYRTVAGDEQIQPDATVSARHRPIRVFVELDRSSRSLGRIAVTIERYRRYFAEHYGRDFADAATRRPILLFVVRSAGRRAGIARLLARTFRSDPGRDPGPDARHDVHLHRDAVAWFEARLLDATVLAAAADSAADSPGPGKEGDAALREIATEIYTWMHSYRKQMRASGADFPEEGTALLRRLYHELEPRESDGGERSTHDPHDKEIRDVR